MTTYNQSHVHRTLLSVCPQVKHALLDEDDISIVDQFGFEARVDIDPNGDGAQIFAWCYDLRRGRAAGQYLHTYLWRVFFSYMISISSPVLKLPV